MEKDLIVIGGGPGGYVAAIRAAQLGANVTLIEKGPIGGTCLNWGCIPTKALYQNAQIIHTLQGAEDFGLSIPHYDFNIQVAQQRKQEIVTRLQTGILHLLKNLQINVVSGSGTLLNPTTVEFVAANGVKEQIKGKNILLATGSRPAKIPIPGIDLPGVITSEEALALDHIPERLVIIGGGVIGIEFAGIYQAFGSEVTVVELLPQILPSIDQEITRRFTLSLKKKGIKIVTGTKVTAFVQDGNNLKVVTQDKEKTIEASTNSQETTATRNEGATYLADTVLVSVGRSVNTENLNLEGLGIIYNPSGIQVDDHYLTSVPGIYAIGDVIGGKMLAHVASAQGKSVAENLFGAGSEINHETVASCVFSFPELASVGLSEQEAKARGLAYRTSKFMFSANGKALTMGEGEGLVKVLAREDNNEIIGVHIMGPHASDLIHEGALAIAHRLNAKEIGRVIHAHPTLAESFHEAILGLDKQAIHMSPSR